jgi:hypothetical protein
MATFSLSEWKRRQNEAAERETAYRAARIREIEIILGLPLSGSDSPKRLKNLQAQAAIAIREELKHS